MCGSSECRVPKVYERRECEGWRSGSRWMGRKQKVVQWGVADGASEGKRCFLGVWSERGLLPRFLGSICVRVPGLDSECGRNGRRAVREHCLRGTAWRGGWGSGGGDHGRCNYHFFYFGKGVLVGTKGQAVDGEAPSWGVVFSRR